MKQFFFMPVGPITFPPDLLAKFTPLRGALLGLGILLLIMAMRLLLASPRKSHVAKLGGLRWKRNQFCRGWLITGDTGSGKTSSGINQLAHQVFQNEPTWGGLCIDEKGVYWETLSAMARHYGREHDLIHLQIRADDTDAQWTPPNRYNLTGDRSIPFTTYAKFIVDTATSLGQGGDKGFFKSQAQTHIAHALEMLFELNRPVTLTGAFELLSDRELLAEEMENLEGLLETPRRAAVYAHFGNRFLNQPDEQLGGVRETIGNYLQYFLTPEVAEVFCTGESTFDFATIDQGKIILTTMPQKFQTERRYVNTLLKLLFYNHALRRFDKAKADRVKNNLLILWADEAQRFMTASEDGTSDYNCVDVTRVGPQEDRIGVSQMFPWFGKLKLRGEAALEGANAAQQQYEAAKLKLFDEVKQSYYELYYLGRAIGITEENVQLLEYFEEVARSKYEAGTALHADVIKAQVELDRLRDRLRTLQDVKQPTLARLNAALNRRADALLPWPTNFPPAQISTNTPALVQRLIESNPELKSLDYLAAKDKANIALAKKEFYPDVTLGADYIVTGPASMPNTPDSGQDAVIAGFSINIPLWWGKYRAGVREAESRYAATQQERQDRANTLTTDLKLALFKYQDSERKIVLYRDALIPKADENVKVIQRSFEAGKSDFLSLIDAERILLEFQLTYERAVASREQGLSTVEKLVGGNASPLQPERENKP